MGVLFFFCVCVCIHMQLIRGHMLERMQTLCISVCVCVSLFHFLCAQIVLCETLILRLKGISHSLCVYESSSVYVKWRKQCVFTYYSSCAFFM